MSIHGEVLLRSSNVAGNREHVHSRTLTKPFSNLVLMALKHTNGNRIIKYKDEIEAINKKCMPLTSFEIKIDYRFTSRQSSVTRDFHRELTFFQVFVYPE